MKKIILFAMVIVAVMSSCSSSKSLTLGQQYAALYEEKPLTIAIMPPINQTTHPEAKDYFYTTMYLPLCEKGYYVFSPYLTMEMFQQESAYDAEQFIDADLSIFQNVLGADAAMFTIIKDWKKNALGGKLTVNIEYRLRSTKTGQVLYQKEGNIKLDTSISGGNSAIGALVGMIATAVNTGLTDKVVAGRKCNAYVLTDLPAGKYSPLFEQDAENPATNSFIKATIK